MKWSYRFSLLIVALIGVLWISVRSQQSQQSILSEAENRAEPPSFIGPPVPPEYQISRIEDHFPADSTLQDVLFGIDFEPRDVHQLITETREVYDLNKVVAGNLFAIEQFGDGRFRKFEYELDDEKYLTVRYDEGAYRATLHERQFDTELEQVSGTISDNLWNTLVGQGESGLLVMNIHELMQWDIDFTTIQPNDSFKLIFEKLFYRGEFVKYGSILAMQFIHGGKKFHAFRYFDENSGKYKFYDAEGKGVKKAFLKVPFKYDYRISSGFSHSRFHPVHKQRMPHYGVDYAAPHGTPVLASASGRVVFAGRKGANGRLVMIRHPNRYVTYYLHLSKILVKQGQSVAQGDVIGRVGSTGVSTGPHLDYRIRDREGRFINPKKYVALPSDTGITEAEMGDFLSVRDAYLQQLDAIPSGEGYLKHSTVAG